MQRIVKTNGSIAFKLKLPKHLKENHIARIAKYNNNNNNQKEVLKNV